MAVIGRWDVNELRRRGSRWLLRRRYSPRRLRRLIDGGAFSDREILAYRTDGFGMRMGELLNASRLAEAFGARFVFVWPVTDNDGIRPAGRVFASAFLQDHLLDGIETSDYPVVGTWDADGIRELHRGRGRGIWSVSKRSLSPKKKFVLGTSGIELPPLMSMREAFDRIPFSPELAAIKSAVEEVAPFDVALHIRRGDIVSTGAEAMGTSLLDGTYSHKAVPLPLVDEIVRRATAAGQRVVIIGNGVDALDLAERYVGVIFARDIAPFGAMSPELEDFLDFCLLARSATVVSGGSAFAMVPTLIGAARSVRVPELLTVTEQLDLIRSFLAGEAADRPAEAMLACSHVLRMDASLVDHGVRLQVVALAARADPANPVLTLAHAALLLDGGLPDRASAVLSRGLTGRAIERLLALAARDPAGGEAAIATLGGTFLRAAEWELLDRNVSVSPWIALVVGLRALASGHHEKGTALVGSAAGDLDGPTAQAARALLSEWTDSG